MDELLGTQNGRLMAAYPCYSLASNPHEPGTKAHADFVAAFSAATREASAEVKRLSEELDITNADHVALWLERNMDPSAISWLAVRIVEAHEAAMTTTQHMEKNDG